jgi:hypothetical protein
MQVLWKLHNYIAGLRLEHMACCVCREAHISRQPGEVAPAATQALTDGGPVPVKTAAAPNHRSRSSHRITAEATDGHTL